MQNACLIADYSIIKIWKISKSISGRYLESVNKKQQFTPWDTL